MIIRNIAIAATACITLTACGDTGRVVGTERRAAVIVSIDEPKHFGVTVRDATGHVQKISVSKHCNQWRSRTRIGMKIPVFYQRITYKDGRRALRVTNRGLEQRLCGGW
jgi:hypothetical protein